MPTCSSISITIRYSHLLASTIIGYVRVVIDNKILLKELPIFRSGGQYAVQLTCEPVAACKANWDIQELNEIIWSLRDVIELAILNELKKQKNGTNL